MAHDFFSIYNLNWDAEGFKSNVQGLFHGGTAESGGDAQETDTTSVSDTGGATDVETPAEQTASAQPETSSDTAQSTAPTLVEEKAAPKKTATKTTKTTKTATKAASKPSVTASESPTVTPPAPAQPPAQSKPTTTSGPKSMGTTTDTSKKTVKAKTTDAYRPLGEVTHGALRFGGFMSDDDTALPQTPPHKSINVLLTDNDNGFMMNDPVSVTDPRIVDTASEDGSVAGTVVSPDAVDADEGGGSFGWMMTGKNVPKEFATQRQLPPLAALLKQELFGFINSHEALAKMAEGLWEERFIVDNFEKAAGHFFEALSICHQANRNNNSPEYRRAISQLSQFGQTVLSALKSYGLTAEAHGFGESLAAPVPAEQGSAQPLPVGDAASASGRPKYDGTDGWYIDEQALRQYAQAHSKQPQYQLVPTISNKRMA